MSSTELIAELNAGYRLPADAGPAWRAAWEMGMDMSLIECNLDMNEWERIMQNDTALALASAIYRSNPLNNGESWGDH